ncbi:MAG: hypothetical protein P1U56_10640 [Saprospiraceae bacterium]|nr:hypothetical protein [Saprospiraceae bacterium]
MKIQLSRSFILKLIVIGVLVTGFIYSFSGIDSDAYTITKTIEPIDVPHSFDLDASRLFDADVKNEEIGRTKLNKYDIRNALLPIFECEGLKMREDFTLEIDGMKFPITAYDPNFKIGYVLLDYNLFGEGLIDENLVKYKSQKQAEQEFLSQVEDGVELYLDDEEKFLLDIFGEEPQLELAVSPETVDEKFSLFIDTTKYTSEQKEEIINSFLNERTNRTRYFSYFNSTRRKWSFFREAYDDIEMLYEMGQEIKAGMSDFQTFQDKKEYLELVFLGFKKEIYLNSLNAKTTKTYLDEWIFSAAEKIKEPLRFFGFVERIKYLSYPSTYNSLSKELEREIVEISTTSNTKKWWEHSEALIQLLQANKSPVTNSKREYDLLLEKILTNYNYKKWSKYYKEINELGNEFTISKSELIALLNISETHGISIAPLSILDDRMLYDMKEEEYKNQLAELRNKINKTKNKTERKELQKELLELTDYRSKHYTKIRSQAKAISSQRLIEDMQEFLEWAFEVSQKWEHGKGV